MGISSKVCSNSELETPSGLHSTEKFAVNGEKQNSQLQEEILINKLESIHFTAS